MRQKKEYYRLTNIEKLHAQYNILLGERANGKSYSVKERVLMRAYAGEGLFAYLRRYDRDIVTTNVLRYFADMPIHSITSGEYEGVTFYRGDIFFCTYDEKTNKPVKGPLIGHALALNNDERIKSQAFPNVTDIIYEEFITDKFYLQEEPTRLQNLVSTIARDRNVSVWLIGNKINRICPYFTEWQLTGIPKQELGTIDTYRYTRLIGDEEVETVIAVENCNNAGTHSKMFFGKSSEAITGGTWQTKEMPKLARPLEEYEMLYELLLSDCGFTFVLQLLVNEDGGMIVYVYPYTRTRNIRRKITTVFSDNPLTTPSFNVKIRAETIMKDCINSCKVCYSDNLTGTDFEQVLMNRKGVL